jgi:YD repeat-containing protein
VDDFGAAYRKAAELGVGEGSGYFSKVYQLPDGAVQLYVRDPAGNLVEINWPDVTTLDRSVVNHVEKVPGKPEARLYMRE